MRVGSGEHYGWDDWYPVRVRHEFGSHQTDGSSYAWLEGPRGPRGEPLSLLVTARTPPRGWREPAAGKVLDVWAWPVSPPQAAQWSAALARGEAPVWRDPGSPEQWLQVRGDAADVRTTPHRLERAPMFRGLTFRGRPPEGCRGLDPGDEQVSATGVVTSADPRVATRNFERSSLWCVLGDEGRLVDDPPGLSPMREVFFLPGTTFRTLASWRDDIGEGGIDLVLVHQLDTVRGPDTDPFVEPSRVPRLVHALLERALAQAPLRLRDPGRFTGPLSGGVH